MKDVLPGALKVKRIMAGKTYVCRTCGLAYARYQDAKNCHKKGGK